MKQKTRKTIYKGLDLFLLGNLATMGALFLSKHMNWIPPSTFAALVNYNTWGCIAYCVLMGGMKITAPDRDNLSLW